jgi:uncharacterized membrane protein YjgN (DUF898 family)
MTPMSACSEPVDVDTPHSTAADPTTADPLAAPGAGPQAFVFNGSGAEYFRIWIVNWLLTLATLGIYSAWAKTWRLQYFYRNTEFAGASFDFSGEPEAVLRGRLLALLLLGALYLAFGASIVDGFMAGTLVLAALPFIIRSALRFRLANTWYRGLPFGFAGTLGNAYRVYLLPLGGLLFSEATYALAPDSVWSYVGMLPYVCWPWMHGAVKRYQHMHLTYGDAQADFPLSVGALAKPYVPIFVLSVVVIGTLFVVPLALFLSHHAQIDIWGQVGDTTISLYGYLFVVLGLPFTAVRMTNLAWSATTIAGVRIACDIRPGAFLRLQAVNWLLTLATLGLFRPFAAVRAWRYRLACMRVHAPEGFALASLCAAPANHAATGESLADLLDVDLSW